MSNSSPVSHQGVDWGVFNPFSPEFKEAETAFHELDGWRKTLVVIASIAGGFFFIVGAFPVFCWTVNALKPGEDGVADEVDKAAHQRFGLNTKTQGEGDKKREGKVVSSKATVSKGNKKVEKKEEESVLAKVKSFFTPEVEMSTKEICEEAIHFAEQALLKYPDTIPWEFVTDHPDIQEVLQPLNPKIALLVTLYKSVYLPKYKQTLPNHPNGFWNQPEYIQAADELMKISYAITTLTLNELPEFMERLPPEKRQAWGAWEPEPGVEVPEGQVWGLKERTGARTLVASDSYQRIFLCSYNSYMGLLVSSYYKTEQGPDGEVKRVKASALTGRSHLPDELSRELLRNFVSFYKSGTIQNKWHRLYNAYTDHIRRVINIDELCKINSMYVNYTKKDERLGSFTASFNYYTLSLI